MAIKSGFISKVAELKEQGITDEQELFDILKDGDYPQISGINLLSALRLISMGLHKDKDENKDKEVVDKDEELK